MLNSHSQNNLENNNNFISQPNNSAKDLNRNESNPYSPNSKIYNRKKIISKNPYMPGKVPSTKTLKFKKSSSMSDETLKQLSPFNKVSTKTVTLKSDAYQKKFNIENDDDDNQERNFEINFIESSLITNNEINEKLTDKLNKEEISNLCTKVFMYMAKFSKEHSTFLLSQQHLLKILKEVGIINKLISFPQFDIIAKKVNPNSNKYDLKSFKVFLAHIANQINPSEFTKNSKLYILQFIYKYFSYYGEKIERNDKNTYGYADNNILSTMNLNNLNGSTNMKVFGNFLIYYKMGHKLILFINHIYSAIKEIYHSYFIYEIGHYEDYEKIKENSLKNLFSFCTDFEIFPYMIKRDQIVIYWNYLININFTNLTNNEKYTEIIDEKKDLGTVFKLSKFCTMIVHLSKFTYSKNNIINNDTGK